MKTRTLTAIAPRKSRWFGLPVIVAAGAALIVYLFLASGSAGAATVTLLPQTDKTNPGVWTNDSGTTCNGTPVATCAGRIDEDIDSPNDADYAQSPNDPILAVTETTLADAPDDLSTLSAIAVRYRAYKTGTKAATVTVAVVDGSTNTVIGSPTVQTLSGSATAYSYTLTGLSLTQSQVDGLYLRLTANTTGAGTATRVIVTVVNLDTTHTTVAPNPVLPQTCGIDMVLAIDSSGSITGAELTQLKTAYNMFVDALLPGTPTQIAIIDFDTSATVLTGFTNNAATLHAAINSVTSGGLTNWEDPLRQGRLLFPNRADKPDLIIMGSDGDPNTTGHSPLTSFVGEPAAVQAAITQADLAKNAGIRIDTLAIGNPDISNLESISSPDAVTSTSYTDLQADLITLARDLCGGVISVHKLIDADGDPNTTGDQTSTAGWTFNCTPTSGGGDACVPINATTGADGFTQFDVTIDGDGSATVNITETVQSGYAVISAECHAFADGPIGTWNNSNAVNGIVMHPADIGLCTFINSVQKPFDVVKDFIPNNATPVTMTLSCANGIVAPGSANAVDGGAPAHFTDTGFTGNPTCTATEPTIPTGYESTGTCNAPLLTGTCTITNTLRTATFKVAKDFQPDSAAPVNITINCTSGSYTANGSATDSVGGEAVFTITGFTPPASCTAMENPVPSGYTPNQANCMSVAITNNGTSTCTIVNVLNTATLNVLKDYTPDDPLAPNVTISVTCTSGTPSPASAPANEGMPASFTISGFDPPATCTATETAPPGYNGNQANCMNVAITVGGTSNCTITNTAIQTPFQVLKDFTDNNPMSVTVSLACASGTTSPSSTMASEGSPGNFTVIAPIGDPSCTATENPVPLNYTSTGTCTANLSAGSCTITNTYNPVNGVAQFQVFKDFTDNNPMDVNVSLVCMPGAVTMVVDGTASESDPADFTVDNQPGTTCSASEAPVAGYVANAAACQNVPLANGSCTITNTPGTPPVGGFVDMPVAPCCSGGSSLPLLLGAALAAFVAACTGGGVWRLVAQRR